MPPQKKRRLPKEWSEQASSVVTKKALALNQENETVDSDASDASEASDDAEAKEEEEVEEVDVDGGPERRIPC